MSRDTAPHRDLGRCVHLIELCEAVGLWLLKRWGATPYKTTEFIAYIAAVVGVIILSAAVKTTTGHGDYFRADKAMLYIVILTVGYLVSRGIAKSGSRDYYDDDRD